MDLIKIVEQYIAVISLEEGELRVNARIVQYKDGNYNYNIDHYTTMGGGTSFYYKDHLNKDINETRNFMVHHLSLFEMPGAKHEPNLNY